MTQLMFDSILKYLSVITVAGAAISFVVGLVKYLDQRNREVRTKRFELFHDLMRRISAFGEREGEGVPLTQQVAAVYELQHFTEYAYASVPILEHLREFYAQRDAPEVLLHAIDNTLKVIKQ
jgi:hypothetical protein